MTDEVVLAEYDPRWPAQFEAEAARIGAAVGGRVLAFHHVGSTSVPGLVAKPVIDIQGVVPSMEEADRLVPLIVSLGYEYDATWEHEVPRRRYFLRRQGGVRTHHLHLVDAAYWLGRDQLMFRDHLRRHAGVAARYAALKRELAAQFPGDRNRYTQEKAEFVGEALAVARQEAPIGAFRGHAIVVGGTGMLAPLSLALAARGHAVSVVARSVRRLSELANEAARANGVLAPVCVDYRDSAALAFGLERVGLALGPPELAVVWAHSAAPDAPFVVAKTLAATGRRTRLFHVLGSAAADPSLPDAERLARFATFPRLAYHEVILGFVLQPGGSRWLTDDEISEGVLRAVDSRAPRTVVGDVEPWEAKP